MKIRNKLSAGYIIIIPLIAVSSLTGIWAINFLVTAHTRVSREMLPVVMALNDIRYRGLRIVSSTSEYGFIAAEQQAFRAEEKMNPALLAAETALIAAGEKSFLEAISGYERLEELHSLAAHDRARVLRTAGEELLEISKRIISLKKQGVTGADILAHKEDLEEAEFAFLQLINSIIDKEKEELLARLRAVHYSADRGERSIIVVSLLALLLAFFCSLYLPRRIIGPIDKLVRASMALSGGNLDARVDLSSDDELGKLAERFNAMAATLKQQYAVLHERILSKTAEFSKTKQVLSQEISERKVTEQWFKAMARSLETILDCAIPISITSKNCEIVRANKAYQENFGSAQDQNLQCYESRLSSILCHTKQCPLQQIVKGRREEVITESVRKTVDGSERVFLQSARPFRNLQGEIDGMVVSYQDITKRKKAETDLAHAKEMAESSRDRLQAIITTFSDIFSMIAKQKIIEPEMLKFPDNPNLPTCWEMKNCSLTQCSIHGRRNVRCWHQPGTLCSGNSPARHVKTFKDCRQCNVYKTATRDQNYGILEAFNNMLHVVKISHERLSAARRTAEEATRHKTEFVANMSHEFRTPLNGIIGMAELCLATELTEEQQKYLNLVYTEAAGLLNLINDTLDYSKIDAGRLELEVIPFNLEDLLKDLDNIFHFPARQKGIKLHTFLAGNVPVHLVGDPGRLRQIFVNLIGNALKFTPEGGRINVRVELMENTGAGLTLQCSVSDTGIGIPEEKQTLIFESFRQADGSTTRKYGGSGLGTTISKQLAEAMGGGITVASDGRSGTTFTFTVVLARQLKLKDPVVVKEVDLHSLRVFLVDDNPGSREEVKDTLLAFGCIVMEAAAGKEALAVLTRQNREVGVDLIITTIQTAAVDGFDLAAAVRNKEDLKEVPIIAVTPVGLAGDSRRCIDAGINAYVTSPLDPAELRKLIAMVLADHHESMTKYHLTAPGMTDDVKEKIRILLVEDYPTNQQVALHQLEKAGFTVDLAENGRLAVEAHKREPYSLILMDVQMPVMDGYDATTAIRMMEEAGITGSRVPIVAMTAHAMKGDREKCLEAGMDDYLTKPLQRKELLNMVKKWTATIAQYNMDQEEEQSAERAMVAEKVMNLERAVEEFEGDREFLMKILNGFLSNVKQQFETIEQAIGNNNAEVVRREAHSIKGGAANLTAEGLRSIAFELENIGSSGNLGGAAATFSRLVREFDRLHEFSRNINQKIAGEAGQEKRGVR